jgi:hypothetical protein
VCGLSWKERESQSKRNVEECVFVFDFVFAEMCSIGYNYSKNVASHPVGGLLRNLIRRHVYEKGFLRVFGAVRARLPSTMRKSAYERKSFFPQKNSIWL